MINSVLLLALAAPQGQWETHLEIIGTPSDHFSFGQWVGDLDQDGAEDFGLWQEGLNPGLTVRSGRTGSEIFFLPDSANPFQYHGFLEAVDDLNSDGYPDFVLYNPSGLEGAVLLYSGRDGALLWRTVELNSLFGTDVALIPDRTGDGVSDLAVSDPGHMSNMEFGNVHVLSGASGAYSYSYTYGNQGDPFGSQVEVLDDLDGDGVSELVTCGGLYDDLLILESGGAVSAFPVPIPSSSGGFQKLASGDFNGDGLTDLAVSAGDLRFPRNGVVVLDAPTFSLREVVWSPEVTSFPNELQATPDFDGDGCDDLLCHGMEWPSHNSLTLYSGATGTVLVQFIDPDPFQTGFPSNPSTCLDASGDGRPELMIGMADYANIGTGQSSLFRLVSGPAFLLLEISELISGQFATSTVSRADPGRPVWLLASKQAEPSTLPGGVPVNLGQPLQAVSQGITDSNGQWHLQATIPSSVPIGEPIFFQVLCLDSLGSFVPSNVVCRVVQ